MASRNSSRLLLLGLGGWIALLTASCGLPGDSPPARELAKADPNCPLSGAQKKKAVKAFEAMMPVFRHPRCSNCHGGIDPSKAEGGHLGGKIEPVTRRADPKNNFEDMNMERKPGEIVVDRGATIETCQECHSELPVWNQPDKAAFSFVGKNTEALCKQIKERHGSGENFVEHIRRDHDRFVLEAFKGTRGLNAAGQAMYEDAAKREYRLEPPAITHAEFIEQAERWVQALPAGAEFQNNDCGCVAPRDPGYAIRIHRKNVSEKLGTVSDVSYDANLTPNEDGGLNGTGTYSGTIVTWQSFCPGDPKPKTHAVSGSLKANGNVVSFGSKSLLMYMLETTDWPLIADGPPAETGEEREEFKTTGSVGNPLGLTLQGPITTHVNKSKGNLLETDCTGGFENTVETTVELIK